MQDKSPEAVYGSPFFLAKEIMKVIPEPYEMDIVRGTIYWIFISDRISLERDSERSSSTNVRGLCIF
jgi:hypothetical protein